jgi:hypothetical protein
MISSLGPGPIFAAKYCPHPVAADLETRAHQPLTGVADPSLFPSYNLTAGSISKDAMVKESDDGCFPSPDRAPRVSAAWHC